MVDLSNWKDFECLSYSGTHREGEIDRRTSILTNGTNTVAVHTVQSELKSEVWRFVFDFVWSEDNEFLLHKEALISIIDIEDPETLGSLFHCIGFETSRFMGKAKIRFFAGIGTAHEKLLGRRVRVTINY